MKLYHSFVCLWYGRQDLICILPQKGQNNGSPPSSRRRQQTTGLLHLDSFKSCTPLTKRKRGAVPLFFFWYGRQDLNLHGNPLEPKSNVSANSTTPANIQLIVESVRFKASAA